MVPHEDDPLSARAQQAIHDGEAAWVRASSSQWDASTWWRIGTALTLLRQQTLHEMGINKARGGPYNEAFARRISGTKFVTMEPVTRSNLLFLMEPEIRIVLDGLLLSWPPDVRAKRTHPTTLAQHVRRELKPPPKPAPAAKAKPAAKAEPLTDPERRKLEGELLKVKLENDELREQLAQAKAAEPEQVRALRQQIRDLEQGHARRDSAAKAAQTKAEKPTLPPDEVRDRRIKTLETKLQDANRKLNISNQHFVEFLATAGALPRATKNAIDKVLHPDTRAHATEADKDLASKVWNAWHGTRMAAAKRATK